MKFTYKIAEGFYTILARKKSLIRPGVRNDLERLNPGANQEMLCRDYYVSKLEKSMLIFVLGSVVALLVAVRAAGERGLQENMLKRGEVTDEAQEITVEAVIEGKTERFQVQVQPTQMSEEEADECFQEFCAELPKLILGSNSSILEVEQNLLLEESYEGYPFSIEWKSEDSSFVTSAGVVTAAEEEKEVCLKAQIRYGDMEWEYSVVVIVPAEKLTEEEKRYREVEESLLDTEMDTRQESYWTLPGSLGDAQLEWRRVVQDNSALLWAGVLVVSVAVYLLGDRDLHEQVEKRREQMRGEYPDIVYKIALYLGAGMTLQGAFQKIAAEYEQSKALGKTQKHAYEEMLFTCRELKSGVSEGSAYEHFGKRTGLQEYIRLSTLMTQNLKKGSASLMPRLREEVDKSLTERIRMGRKLGEEAATKLLVPMVMMLAVVMVMVMLPAFSSMGV